MLLRRSSEVNAVVKSISSRGARAVYLKKIVHKPDTSDRSGSAMKLVGDEYTDHREDAKVVGLHSCHTVRAQ